MKTMDDVINDGPLSAHEIETYGWLNRLIHSHVQRLDVELGAEPTEEPKRAVWHLTRNSKVLSLRGAIEAAYAEKYGPVSQAVAEHVNLMCLQYWTNPYRGDTVWRRAASTT